MRLRERGRAQVIDDAPLPLLGEIEVVEVRAAGHAQWLEVRPQQQAARRAGRERAARGAQGQRFDARAAFMALENVAQRVLARWVERREKARHLGRLNAEAVVARTIEKNHREAAFD